MKGDITADDLRSTFLLFAMDAREESVLVARDFRLIEIGEQWALGLPVIVCPQTCEYVELGGGA